MDYLLTIERIILESISRGHRDLHEIQEDVGLELSITISILSRLIRKGLVIKARESGEYEILENDFAWSKVMKSDAIHHEVSEIGNNIIDIFFNNKDKAHLKLQKIYMSQSDEKIFNSLLYNIEIFIKNLKRDQREKRSAIRSHEQKVILWGYTTYKEVLNNVKKVC